MIAGQTMACNGKSFTSEEKVIAVVRKLLAKAKADNVTGFGLVRMEFYNGGPTAKRFEITWSENVS